MINRGATEESSPDHSINVEELLDTAPLGSFQWRVVVLCFLAAMLDGFDVQAIAFVVPVLAPEWDVVPAAFATVFAAGLLGLCIGSAGLGPVADRIGRRRSIIIAMMAMGVFSLLTATAHNLSQMIGWRFATGLALGGLLPSVFALTAEYVPARIRTTMVTVMFCGFPAGAVLGGAVCAQTVPIFGWQSVFIAGGVLPIALSLLLFIALPESLSFLIVRGGDTAVVQTLLRRLHGEAIANTRIRFTPPQQQVGHRVADLFASSLLKTTILLWILFFMTLYTLYFLINWLPVILNQAGIPVSSAILGTVLLNLGGIVGALTMARLIDRFGTTVILVPAYAASAVAIIALGLFGDSTGRALLLTFAAGFFVLGVNFAIAAWASNAYPTTLRSTAVGWALSVGRVGSIISPLVGGGLLANGWSANHILLGAAIPSVCCSVAILALARASTAASRQHRS